MKRLIPVIVAIAFIMYPFVCFPSYVIRLKNGSEFVTYQYWEEGGVIKFYHRGGITGIQKDFVKKIIESDVAYKEEIDSGKGIITENGTDRKSVITPAKTGKTHSKVDGPKKKTESKNKKEDKKIDFEYYKDKKLLLKNKLDKALERFHEASRNKDSEAKKKSMEDMTEISRQIFALADELKEKNNGMLPDWWEEL